MRRLVSSARARNGGSAISHSLTSRCWSRTFPGRADQVHEARAFLAALLDDGPDADGAVLCVSELAANAVQHSKSGESGGTFTVRVALARSGAFLVTVDDSGGPWLPRPDPDVAGGRGLLIVRELAADSGILGNETGRTAWFCMRGFRLPRRVGIQRDQVAGCTMTRIYLVQLSRAEARHLAGVGVCWPATPETRCIHAVREWLNALLRSRAVSVSVRKIAGDLESILGSVPVVDRPQCGPFSMRGSGRVLPGHAQYLGGRIVRLDGAAISSLAGLGYGEDFRVVFEDVGPVLTVGNDRYVVREEEPDDKP
jgi:serine/threonine-protein kinase RsbW